MQLLPSDLDRTPDSVRFWVQSSAGGIVPTEVIYEAPEAVEERLERDFPVYRALQVGKKAAGSLMGRDHEV